MRHVAVGSPASSSAESDALLATAAALQPVVRDYQDENERERRIAKPVVQRLRTAGLYRMVVPQQIGGVEGHPLTLLPAAALIAGAGRTTGGEPTHNPHPQVIRPHA